MLLKIVKLQRQEIVSDKNLSTVQGLNTGPPSAAVMEDEINAKNHQKNHAFICDKFLRK